MTRSSHDGPQRGGGTIDDRQAQAIRTLADISEYRGKSRLATLLALPRDQKWGYFRDQLLARVAAAIAAIIVVTYLAVQILTPTPAPQLYVAVINSALSEQDAATLQTSVSEALNLPEGREGGVAIDANFNLKESGLTKLQTMLSNDEIDAIIAAPDDFETLAGYGYMRSLSRSLTERQRKALSGAFADFRGFNDADDTDIDYDGSGKGGSKPYGLKLADAPAWTALRSADDTALIGLAQDSHNTGNAQRLVTFLTE